MDWRFSSFLLSLFVLLLAFSWGTSQHGLCSSEFVADVLSLRNKDGALNCFEFWFNRYQSFAGAVLALIVAWLATIPARGQLREMSRQSAASARQAKLDAARALEDEIDVVSRLITLDSEIQYILYSFQNDNPHNNYQTLPKAISAVEKKFLSGKKHLKIVEARSPVGDAVSYARQEAIECTAIVVDSLNALWRAHPSEAAFDDEYSVAPTDEEIRKAPGELTDDLFLWREAMHSLLRLLERAKREAWSDVRTLEKQSTSG